MHFLALTGMIFNLNRIFNSSFSKSRDILFLPRTKSSVGSYWKDKFQNGGFGVRKTFLHIVMPSHYNCCIPLCTNHSRKIRNLSFYRIPKDESLRKKYTRLIRNKTLKLESSHTRICSAHFEEVRRIKKYSWSKPCKERKLP